MRTLLHHNSAVSYTLHGTRYKEILLSKDPTTEVHALLVRDFLQLIRCTAGVLAPENRPGQPDSPLFLRF